MKDLKFAVWALVILVAVDIGTYFPFHKSRLLKQEPTIKIENPEESSTSWQERGKRREPKFGDYANIGGTGGSRYVEGAWRPLLLCAYTDELEEKYSVGKNGQIGTGFPDDWIIVKRIQMAEREYYIVFANGAIGFVYNQGKVASDPPVAMKY